MFDTGMFGGIFDDIFREQDFVTKSEYREYKGTTPYKLMRLKSGEFALTFSGSLLDYREKNKEVAKKHFVDVCKTYKAII